MNTGTAEKNEKSHAIFISDLHLTESASKTTEAFLNFINKEAKNTKSLYILGDLFEYWAGDDDIENDYNRRIINAIKGLSESGVSVFWVPGNRDFLTGNQFAAESAVVFLPDLHTIEINNHKIAIAHGDAQCLEDADYVKFRAMVRSPQWQQQFLSMPLEKRKFMIESFRKDSQKANQEKSGNYWDVTLSAVDAVFQQTGANIFIHGHTHNPDKHEHGTNLRYVLSDWDMDGDKKRGGWLELTSDGRFIQHVVNS